MHNRDLDLETLQSVAKLAPELFAEFAELGVQVVHDQCYESAQNLVRISRQGMDRLSILGSQAAPVLRVRLGSRPLEINIEWVRVTGFRSRNRPATQRFSGLKGASQDLAKLGLGKFHDEIGTLIRRQETLAREQRRNIIAWQQYFKAAAALTAALKS